jgi:hypothetical protein
MSAARALIEMTAECGRTTARNGPQDLDVLPTNPLAVSLDEGCSRSADEIGNLERRPGHWDTSLIVTLTYIKTAWQSLLRSRTRSVRRWAATSKRAFWNVNEAQGVSRRETWRSADDPRMAAPGR